MRLPSVGKLVALKTRVAPTSTLGKAFLEHCLATFKHFPSYYSISLMGWDWENGCDSLGLLGKGGFMEVSVEDIKVTIKLKISPRKKRDN